MLEQELGEMQSALEAVSDKTQALLADLPARERRDMETLLASVQTRHNELFGKVRLPVYIIHYTLYVNMHLNVNHLN